MTSGIYKRHIAWQYSMFNVHAPIGFLSIEWKFRIKICIIFFFYCHFVRQIQRFNSICLRILNGELLLLPFIIISISLRDLRRIHSMNSQTNNTRHIFVFYLTLRNYMKMSNNLMNAMHSKRRLLLSTEKIGRLLNRCMWIFCFCFVLFSVFFGQVLFCLPEHWLLWRWILFCFVSTETLIA